MFTLNRLFFTTALSFLLVYSVDAQYWSPVFEEGPGWTNSGWKGSIGLTTTFSNTVGTDSLYSVDSSLVIDYEGLNGYGVAAEIGRFTMIYGGTVFHVFEYSLGFNQFNNKQRSDAYGFLRSDSSVFANDQGYVSYQNKSDLSLNLQVTSIIRITEYQFIEAALGLSGHYTLGERESYGVEQALPYFNSLDKFNVYATGEIGFGIKLTPELFVIPNVKVYGYNFANMLFPKLGDQVVTTRHLPVVFGVKVWLHRPLSMTPCAEIDDDIDLRKSRKKKKQTKLF